MRRKTVLAIVSAIAVSAALWFATADVTPKGFKVTAVGGRLKDVKYKTANGYEKVEPGKEYPFGTVLKTGRSSTADLQLSPGNTFRLMPRSKLAIKVDVKNPKLKILKLDQGTVNVKLDKFPKGEKLQVETPTAVCGALGTRFTISFEDDEDEKKADVKKATRENKIVCEKGEVYAGSRFTLDNSEEEGKTFDAPSIKEGTEIVAKVHEGLENSYTDISVNRGSLTINYGVDDGASFKLDAEEEKPARFVCALEKSDDEVETAVIEVKSGTIQQKRTSGFFIKKEELVDLKADDGPVLIKDSKPMKAGEAAVVGEYLAAAKTEAELHSKLVAAGEDVALNKELLTAAARATLLRKELQSRRTRKMLQQIRRAGRRPTQRIRR